MTGRPYIKVHGSLDEAVSLVDAHVTVLADPGARLTSSTVVGPIMTVSGASDVAIYDLVIHDAIGTTNGFGINVKQASAPPQASLTLERVTIRDCHNEGIVTAGLTSLRVSRSVIVGNAGGGALVHGNFSIVNSLFVKNGSPTSNIGGLFISPDSAGDFHLSFNTIADNLSNSNAEEVKGINCGVPMTTANNIIFNNKASPNCSPDYSLLDVGAGPAAHNKFGNPLFKTTMYATTLSPDFYRISDISPAIDAADPATTLMTDIDGDARPSGNGPDIGADELGVQ